MAGQKIEAKDLRCKERKPLQEVIPLPAPFVVYIDPGNLCNFKCSFCPTGDEQLLKDVGRPKAMMDWPLFTKVVDGLKEFGERFKLISLYKDGEPLLNQRFPEMVKSIRDAGIADRIWTKTNGALLNQDLNRRIVAAGLDMICISVEATDAEGYEKLTGVRVDYQKLRDNVADFFQHRGECEVYIKIVDANLSEEQKEKFFIDFQDISTHISIEKLMGWSNSGVKDFTLGTQPGTYDGLPFTDKEVCAYPFYVMAVNADGSVSLCGNDWSHQTVVGNVREHSLKDIWHSKELYDFRMMMLDGMRHRNKACGDCYYLKIVPDNIDRYVSMIKSRLPKFLSSGCYDDAKE